MSDKTFGRTGGQLVVDSLLAHQVDTVFCVPGESYLAVLDALYEVRDRIRVITCRHESGAAFMAEAYAKFTGRPGVVFVTRGPGACNASIGVHTAFQDSTPLVLFVGQVARDQFDREAFQEVDYRLMYKPLAKWITQIERADRVPELVGQAFARAMSARRGPCVVALPEDMQLDTVPESIDIRPVRWNPAPNCGPSEVDEAAALLRASRRPLVIAGGSLWSDDDCHRLADLAGQLSLPIACTFRRQDLLDNRSPSYVGDLGYGIAPDLARHVEQADLIIALGTRLGEVPTQGYTLLTPPYPKQRLIHVHPDATELGRTYVADVGLVSSPGSFLAALSTRELEPQWESWTRECRASYSRSFAEVRPSVGAVHMPDVIRSLRAAVPDNAVICTGAGNYTGWVHRYFEFRQRGTLLGPTNGAMGYSVPAAVAAKVAAPDRVVISFAGDGCFMMTAQELATATQHDAMPIYIVVNNGSYGTIRAHQERHYPGRVMATDLRNPDFVALAKSFGFLAERVVRTEEFAPALDRALKAGGGALIELRVDPQDISTRATLSQIRAAGEAQKSR
jgi:acetolactate synthase-1/2/3 large subunit